jgi:RNA polymerase sigma factor (sigma-70 family)
MAEGRRPSDRLPAADSSEPRRDQESTFTLIDRARAGDSEALELLFARHRKPLQRWASGRLPRWARDISETDDLVQETLLQTFKRIGEFEPRRVGALQAYLRQAVLNRIREELRRKGRQPAATDLVDLEADSGESPLEQAIGCEAVERYEQALARLKPEEREAIIARVEMGYILKPSNIFVTVDGQVKLLDFGIAKLLGEDDTETHITRHAGRVLTASYTAPEQILGGNVTVATDVFALGVVLYELLTGVLPYDRGARTPLELAAHVQHETAERPSTAAQGAVVSGGEGVKRWGRRLRGDLDTITMKALAHEPERRYPSAAALAEDLQRHLTSRPVEARPDSRGYRLRKFVVRHRLGVAASGIVVTAVIAALVVSLYQTAAARREAARAAAAQAFLVSLFEQLDPDRYAGSAPTVRHLLERGSERLDRDLARQPERGPRCKLFSPGFSTSSLSLTRARRTGAPPSRLSRHSSVLPIRARYGRREASRPRSPARTAMPRRSRSSASCSRKKRWSATRASWEATS